MEHLRRLPSDVDGFLSRGGTVLTGNQRAARTLRLDFDGERRADGRKSWEPPAIFAWETWLASLWQQLVLEGRAGSGADRLLLNPSQELQIWRSVVSGDSEIQSSLQSIDSLAEMAARAWQQICGYRGNPRLNGMGVSGDTRAFQRWAQAFTRRCKTDLYLSQAELEATVAAAIARGGFRPGAGELLLIGFDTLTPALSHLVEALRDAGISVTQQSSPAPASELHLAAAKDLGDELIQAALWLRTTLEAQPETRIAVIHPDIAGERAEIDRAFRQILAPELQDIAATAGVSPYEFSLGQPLSRQPMVAVAISLLRWTIAPLPIEAIGRLILSPYFASARFEHLHRAEFDAFMLRRGPMLRPELDLAAAIEEVDRRSNLNGLQRQLHGLQRAAAKLLSGDKQRSFADWADNMREMLHAAAWASAAADTSVEFQTRRKWESALDELATLDFEGARGGFAQALDRLERIARRTLFAPESREAPIQIMGPQEAAGSRFDAVYFLRASDLAWPVRPGLNPLLGWRVQRDLRMPGSDAAEDAEAARRVAARLARSADTIVFSYARETVDARQRPSPAVAALGLIPLPDPPSPAPCSVITLETLEDPGFVPLKNLKVQGGSSVLQLQAACGFRAFAEKRLWSTAPEPREPGMDPRERGNVVHDALDHLWEELGSQARLRALTAEERTVALSRAIEFSLEQFEPGDASPWESAYLDLQRERLRRLLGMWLEVELSRTAFEVELREEKYVDAAIGPLLLSLRVDRVDRVFNEEGDALGEVILDYKTGVATPLAWKSDRPDEPQLPLYAALREPGNIAGIAFASIRPGEQMGLCGLEASKGVLPRAAKLAFATLEEQIADWHRILTGLAVDFADGDARVRPKNYPATCERCQQRILCRLDPAMLEERNEEAEETDG